jgi:1-phosphofructokinase
LAAGLTTACSWGALAVSLPTTLIGSFGAAPTTQILDVDRGHRLVDVATARY